VPRPTSTGRNRSSVGSALADPSQAT
jgi:hypothetical protein